jgi:hypothetical protein
VLTEASAFSAKGRQTCPSSAGIPVGTTFFIVENDHDIEAIYWPHISSGTGLLQNSILAEFVNYGIQFHLCIFIQKWSL